MNRLLVIHVAYNGSEDENYASREKFRINYKFHQGCGHGRTPKNKK